MAAFKGLILSFALIGLLTITGLLLTLALFPSLLLGAINQLPPIASSVLGFPLDWRVSQLDFHQLTLDQFDTELPDGSRIQLQQAELHYDSLGLLRGQLQQLSITSLTIEPGQTSSQLAAADARQRSEQVAAQLEQEWIDLPAFQSLLQLPIDQIRIDQLQFVHPLMNASLLVAIEPQHWRIAGTLQPLPQQLDKSWQLELQLLNPATTDSSTSQGQILGQLKDDQTLLAHWFASIQQDDSLTRLNLRQVVVLPALLQLADELPQLTETQRKQLAPLQQLNKFDSQLQLQMPNHLRWPDDVDLALVSQVDSQQNKAVSLLFNNDSGKASLTLQPNAQQQLARLSLQHSPAENWQLQLQLAQLQIRGSQTDTSNETSPATQAEPLRWQTRLASSLGQTTPLLKASCDQPLQQCQLSSSLQLPYQLSGDGLAAKGDLSLPLTLNWSEQDGFNLQLTAAASSQLQQGDLQANASLGFNSSIRLPAEAPGRLQLNLSQASLKIEPAALAGWQTTPLQFDQTAELQQQWDISGDSPRQLEAGQLQLALQSLTLQPTASQIETTPLHRKTRLILGASQINCDPLIEQPSCRLSMRLRSSQWQQWPVPDARLNADAIVSLAEQKLLANADLKLANSQIDLVTRLQHDLSSGSGDAQFRIRRGELAFSGLGISNLADLTGLNVLSGSLAGQGWIDWNLNQQTFEPNLMLRSDNLSLVYDNRFTAESLNWLLALRPAAEGYNINGQLSARSLNSGIEISDPAARADITLARDFSWFTADLNEMNLRLLGGQIYIPAVRYDSRKPENAFAIKVDALQLGHLAALEPSAEIKAEGALDGALPIILGPDGPSIPQGTLYARSPGGVIRYQSQASIALAQTDPTVGLAMKALENFQFKQLSSDVSYQPDGSLNLGLKFEGHNPDFFDGQATHLNVNLDYNLLDLLASLRVADDLIARLENKYNGQR
ncbi:intermembrane phospholipid transport protein YdbH family protein [Oceanobacter mangrovi]|uniref:intermembrane phospholipid transport protein YdbH family protein n=1 Tax=Oceanobacter mangrovi TaxID=2862510 RepID=UPI001C8DA6A6|nr:YdbH domain-containing protein [Oceanobacter mangrovi]